jgi:hypothetical protein
MAMPSPADPFPYLRRLRHTYHSKCQNSLTAGAGAGCTIILLAQKSGVRLSGCHPSRPLSLRDRSGSSRPIGR